MSDDAPKDPQFDELPEATVERPRGISIVWLIPLVAVLIGGWLAYKTITESGPTITITFEDASGLEAGKTKIKYKSVTVGQVEKIELSGLQYVTVTAKVDKHAEEYMTENSEFWVVRPRIGGGGISGLETLVSGAYIGVAPRTGPRTLTFTGLETPPGVQVDEEGAKFKLQAKDLGSAFPGTQIFHHDIAVGRVVGHKFAEDEGGVIIDIFIEAPHHLLVRDTSRFWQKTGIDVSYGTQGFAVEIESLATLLAGGIAFDTPVIAGGSNEPSNPDTVFTLFKNIKSIGEARYVRKVPYLLHFDGSVRGLNLGAPVEFRGIKVGEVTDVAVTIDPKTLAIEIPVIIELQPERLTTAKVIESRKPYEAAAIMVKRGMRARLETGSLLTGQLFVDLDFYPKLAQESLLMTGKYPEIPTIPSAMDEFRRTATDVLGEIRKVPFNKIGQELLEMIQGANRFANSPELIESVQTLNETIKDVQNLIRESDQSLGQTLDEVQKLTRDLDQAVLSLADSTEETLSAARNAMEIADPNSAMVVNLASTLEELAAAARAIRGLADYLERHPEALVHGKGGERD